MFTSLFPCISIVTLTFDLWPPKSRYHPLTMVNMSAKFDKETCNGVVSIVFTRSMHGQTDGTTEPLCSQAYFHICPLWPWPLNSKINRVHLLIMVNMSAKFDQETHNGLVAIVFISLFPYMPIVTLTFDLWPQNSIGFILSSWITCVPSLIKKHAMV